MPKSTGENWLSAPETAEYLGLTLRTVYRLIDDGEFPAYRMRRVIRIKRADVDAYLDRSRIAPGELRHNYDPE